MKITKAQKDALEVVMKLMDSNHPDKRDYILTLIYGILNIEAEDEKSNSILINPNNGNDRIHIDMPDWIKEMPTPPFIPGDYQPPQVWYNQEPEPIKTDAREDIRYVTEVTYTGDKNSIVHTSTTADIRYNGECEEREKPNKINK